MVAVLGQISAHAFMGLLETAVSKVKSVRCILFHLGLAPRFIDEMLLHILKHLFWDKSLVKEIENVR